MALRFLTGCTHVNIPDSEWCGDMGPDGAACFHTLSTTSRDVPKEQWDTERFGMVCTQSANFAAWKTALEQLCHDTKMCTTQEQQTAKTFFEKIQTLRNHQISSSGKTRLGSGR